MLLINNSNSSTKQENQRQKKIKRTDNFLSLRELQLEELKMLDTIIEFIESNKLTYYLSGGTLLGAIRHHGFIPWDDDIDIMMPRFDYEQLMKKIKEKPLQDSLEVVSLSLNNSNRPFGKVINKKIQLIGKSNGDKYLWIDIFPIDGIGNDKKNALKHIRKIIKYKFLICLKTTPIKNILSKSESKRKKLFKIILKPISYIFPIKICAKKIDKLSKKYPYKESKYVGTVVWPEWERTIQEKNWHNQTVEVLFEKRSFKAFYKWDAYLKTMYGDYMKLPSKDKRINHEIIARK